jgi:hypothetical protein
MRQVRLDPALQAGFTGAPSDAALPAPVADHDVRDAGSEARPGRSLLAKLVRAVRDAAIAVALMATVPIALVAVRGPTFIRIASFSLYVHKSATWAERWRSLVLPKDPSITAEQAGLAYAALQPLKASTGFPTRSPSTTAVKTWRDEEIRPDMFVETRVGRSHLPSEKAILSLAAKGFRPSELAFLEKLANAPAWREFDIVARAPAVDILGGQFTLPFGRNALPNFRPQSYQDIREMATAAVTRAAYHMAIGQKNSAETILRAIVSVGFALIDNSSSTMDEVIGTQIVDTGRLALRQFYEIQHDPRAAALAATPRHRGPRDLLTDVDQFRARQIATVGDPATHRGERFESLDLLAKSSCTNVRELVTGPRGDVRTALQKATRDLPRYASDRALVELMQNPNSAVVPKELQNPISDLAVSAATVAGTAFHNPRFAQCARMLTVW